MSRAARWSFEIAVLLTGLAACGGNAESGGSGASGGQAGSAGAGSGGSVVCCHAVPLCDGSDAQIAGPDACPAGATCYPKSACCSTIWCAPGLAMCNLSQSCDPGDTQLMGACPPDIGSCYALSACNGTVFCLDTACDPLTEPGRHYIDTSAGSCAVPDAACPEFTAPFSNSCGCGCEQPRGCPTAIDCAPVPGAKPSAQCSTDSPTCPYSNRVY